jgi:hypothetical protein
MIINRTAAAILVIVLAAAAAAEAQTRPVTRPAPRPQSAPGQRFFVGVDFGVQTGTEDFNDLVPFTANAEPGNFATAYDVKPGPMLGISVSARVWQRLAVGIAFTGFAADVDGALTASIPHPFFFNRPRTLSGDVTGLTRRESGIHLQMRGLVPVSNRMQLTVFGGPSFFLVEQDIVNGLRYDDSYPYDVVTFTAGDSETVTTDAGVGFNVGADVSYFFTRRIGVGGIAQYATATVEMPSGGTGTVDVKAGGFQVGGGLRLRF